MLENLELAIKEKYTTSKSAAAALKMDAGNLSKIVNSNDPGSFKSPTLKKISAAFPEYNLDWLLFGKGQKIKLQNITGKETVQTPPTPNYNPYKPPGNGVVIGEIHKDSNESAFIDIGNGQFIMVVPIVPIKAQAGYIEHYQDERWIEETFREKHSFAVNRVYRGRYMAFIVDGDSMDNGTPEAIVEGSTVTGREISKEHWRNKFHIHRYKDYVIVHKEAIFIKRITSHDTDNGVIVCNSLNPNKDLYADFELHLNDCLQIFNVVNVTQTR